MKKTEIKIKAKKSKQQGLKKMQCRCIGADLKIVRNKGQLIYARQPKCNVCLLEHKCISSSGAFLIIEYRNKLIMSEACMC